MHPGSPPGWESQRDHVRTDAAEPEVHPGSPPGWESQLGPSDRHDPSVACTPAARRGGSLNDEFEWVTSHVFRRCTPAARRGGSLNLTALVWADQDTACTPAARRGGSLNMTDTHTIVAAAGGAPRQPAGVGVSTSTGHRPCPSTTTCTPAARRGGSLNAMPHVQPARRMACTPAARRGGSLNHLHRQCAGDDGQVHPGSPPGWESQRLRRTPLLPLHDQVHPGSPPGWESQRCR